MRSAPTRTPYVIQPHDAMVVHGLLDTGAARASHECQRQEHEEPPRDEPDIEDQRKCHVLRGMPRDDDTQRDPAIGPRVLQPPAG